MKVIDLFNKGANGEEMPEKIKYNGEIYYLDNGNYSTYNKYGYPERLFQWGWSLFEHLNDEVEIIEEDKKLETIDPIDYCHSTDISKDMVLVEKINEIINYIKKKDK